MVCGRRRHLRFSARCADHGPRQAWLRTAQRDAGAAVCTEGAAIHRSLDGKIAGGHDFLPHPPPARAQRSRRRAFRIGAVARYLSPDDEDRAPGLAARHDDDRHARHQTRRRRPRAPDRAQ